MPYIDDNNTIIFKNEKQIITKYDRYGETWLYGSNSTIYRYDKENLLKVFKKAESLCLIDLFELIKSLNLNTVITPDKYLFIKNMFWGYLMRLARGMMLVHIPADIQIKRFMSALRELEDDIVSMSEKNIEVSDINYLNILYDIKNNKCSLLDLDDYKVLYKPIDLTRKNLEYFYDVVLTCLSQIYYGSFNSYLLNDIRNRIFNIKNITNIEDFFNEIFKMIEDRAHQKIETIGDVRKALRFHL